MKRTLFHITIACLTLLPSVTHLYAFQDSLSSPISLPITEAYKSNYRYLGDILATLPGLWVRDLGTTGQWASFRMAGSDENQPLVLLDGRPLMNPWTGICDLNLVPVEMISKIDVYPSQNPFGCSAIGGLINIVTRDVPSNRPYTKFVYRTGDHNFSDLDITYGQKISSRFEILSGALLQKFGENLPDKKFKGQQIRSKIKVTLSRSIGLRYSVLHNKSDLDIPYSIPIPGDTVSLASPHQKRSRYDHTLAVDLAAWGIRNTVGIDHTAISYDLSDNQTDVEKSYPAQSTAIRFHQRTVILGLPLSLGIRMQRRQLRNSGGIWHKDTIIHGFFHGDFTAFRRCRNSFQVNPHVSTDDRLRWLLSNRLSVKIAERWSMWAGYAEAVRDPTLGERFGYPFLPTVSVTQNQLWLRDSGMNVIANPDLEPEFSRALETGMHWKWRAVQTYIRGYTRTARNLIRATEGDGIIRFTNETKETFLGMETRVMLGPWWGFRSAMTVNLIKATDADKNNLLERPNAWGNGTISWAHDFFEGDLKVNGCLGVRYWTGYWRLVGDAPETSALLYQNPGLMLDFKIWCTVIKNATVSFAVDNILGTDVAYVSAFPMPQQAIRFGFSWELYD